MFGRKSRRRLLRENEAMRQALCWYAARETWRRKGIHQKGAPRKKWQKSPAAFDRGHLAIRVLTLVDEPKSAVWSVSLPPHIDLGERAPIKPIPEEAKPGTPLVIPSPIVSTDTE